jgi:hypothetical protein
MYSFYIALKRIHPYLYSSSQIIGVLGVFTLVVWGCVLGKVFNDSTSLFLLQIGGFPLTIWIPVQPINLFLIGVLELVISSRLQVAFSKIGSYLLRNQHIEKDAKFKLKKKKTLVKPVEVLPNVPHQCVVSIVYALHNALTPLDRIVKKYTDYNGTSIPTDAGHFLILFDTIEDALDYTQLVIQRVKRDEQFQKGFSLALDWIPKQEIENPQDVIKLCMDSSHLCSLNNQGGVLCTEHFLTIWNDKKKALRTHLFKKNPVLYKLDLETQILGFYLFKGSKKTKLVHTVELKKGGSK